MKESGLELLLGCDANSHHVGWGSSNTNAKEEALHNFIMEKDLMLLNRGTHPTFMDCRRHEVLDITIFTTGMVDVVRDWRVSKEPSGSDHSQIRLSLTGRTDIIQRRNPKNSDWKGYREELSLRIQDVPSRFKNREQLEHAAESFGEAVKRFFKNNCVPGTQTGTKKVCWWNNTLTSLRNQLRKAWNKVKNFCDSIHKSKALEERKNL
ncbi:uncharacterized protein [Fopius arisanus]|uniref:Endonuclease/exonuclease/phosphatase domain-containing protein n=1 Tax=Fopius arisanus TaxID=64838 RepID=A0A9R1UAB6_9HYME|nr:PREDICTED: uncharacterized protein LOC105272776 [Fopius arisanus]